MRSRLCKCKHIVFIKMNEKLCVMLLSQCLIL